jgi:nucleoside 2-deoxyribosyltransferase
MGEAPGTEVSYQHGEYYVLGEVTLMHTCPICKNIAATDMRLVDGVYRCPHCGDFSMPHLAEDILDALGPEDADLLRYLPAYIRQVNAETGSPVRLGNNNWRQFARSARGTPIQQKLDRLLRLVAHRTEAAGHFVTLNNLNDGPAIGAIDGDEFIFLLNALIQAQELEMQSGLRVRVMVNGWLKLQPLVGVQGTPGLGFVAMSFHPELNDAYEFGIKAAVIEAGLPEPIRVDRVHHNEKICDRILAEIGRCEFMIADFTLQRAGVYFEAGFAKGLGREVIWMCRSDDLSNLHFDTRQYNHIEWHQPHDLKTQLIDRLRGTILVKRR